MIPNTKTHSDKVMQLSSESPKPILRYSHHSGRHRYVPWCRKAPRIHMKSHIYLLDIAIQRTPQYRLAQIDIENFNIYICLILEAMKKKSLSKVIWSARPRPLRWWAHDNPLCPLDESRVTEARRTTQANLALAPAWKTHVTRKARMNSWQVAWPTYIFDSQLVIWGITHDNTFFVRGALRTRTACPRQGKHWYRAKQTLCW
jgi:hypothetical protein